MDQIDVNEWAKRRIRALLVSALFGLAEQFSLQAWEAAQ